MSDRMDSGNESGAVEAPAENSLYERVGLWLAASEWRYSEGNKGNWYSLQMDLNCGAVRVIIDTNDSGDEEMVIIYCVFPVRVPELRRGQVAEFFSRLNFRAVMSSLQIDMADGEARVINSVNISESEINETTLDRLLSTALRAADRAFGPMLSVAFGEITPLQAHERILAAAERAASGTQLQ